ncbi:MAG: low temperature requirement protein A [Aquihabitans sp.]
MTDLRRHLVPMVGRDPEEAHRASTPLELLFDLSFVVAISVSAGELHHEVAAAHLHDGLIGYLSTFFAIWWAWMNFTWFASSFDTDDVPYRLLTFVQILGVLVLAVGIPDAYRGDFALVTVGYVIMRLAMVTFWLRAARASEDRHTAAIRYAIGIAAVQVFWIARLFVLEEYGIWTFLVLVVAEMCIPAIAEPDASETAWHPEHIAERYSLFTIIVIGESILAATGAIRTALDGGFSTELLTIAVGGMVLVFGLWWLYFERSAHEGLEGDIGRGAFLWGYGHYVLFASLAALGAGIAVAAEVPEDGHGLMISPVGQALAVAVPAAVALATMALLQAFLHQEPVARTARLLVAAVAILVIGGIAEIPLGIDVALMGLVMAAVVAVDVAIQTEVEAAEPQPV